MTQLVYYPEAALAVHYSIKEYSMPKVLIILISLLMLASPAFAEDWITIYNDDLSLVRSNFELDLKQGRQEYNYDDITSRISSESVIVKSLNGGVQVAEQNYEYDLAGKRQIIAKYLSLIHISEPTRLLSISYAVFCLKKKKTTTTL